MRPPVPTRNTPYHQPLWTVYGFVETLKKNYVILQGSVNVIVTFDFDYSVNETNSINHLPYWGVYRSIRLCHHQPTDPHGCPQLPWLAINNSIWTQTHSVFKYSSWIWSCHKCRLLKLHRPGTREAVRLCSFFLLYLTTVFRLSWQHNTIFLNSNPHFRRTCDKVYFTFSLVHLTTKVREL